VRADLLHGQGALAHRRVEDGDALAVGLGQHHEVVQVPVQHAGGLQLRQLVELQAHGPVGEAHLLGDFHQPGQGGTARGQLEATTQGQQVGVMAVGAGDHGQAGQAAFGGFRLQDHGRARAGPQREQV
jgi:hypothetical protein